MLKHVSEGRRPLVVSALISTLRNIWPDNWGPRTEYILSHVAFALLAQPQPVTLLSIPKLLTESAFRDRVRRSVTDSALVSFFDLYDNHWPQRLREEAVAPLLDNVTKFITNPLLRAIIGQPRSSFDFRWLLDERKILLCDLSKGALAEGYSHVDRSFLEHFRTV